MAKKTELTYYIIENKPEGSKVRRIAIIKALNRKEAISKLLEKFPTSKDLRFIKDTRLINPQLSVCIIK
jgi:hypothetical protein